MRKESSIAMSYRRPSVPLTVLAVTASLVACSPSKSHHTAPTVAVTMPPSLPASTTPLTAPSPRASVAQAKPCTAATVGVTGDYGGGLTAGQFRVSLQLTPNATCTLYRMTGVAMIAADGRVVTDASSYSQDATSPTNLPINVQLSPPITITAGQTLGVGGQWSDVCTPVLPPFRIRVTFTDGTSAVIAPPGPFIQGGAGPPLCLEQHPSARLPSGALGLFGASLTVALNGDSTTFSPPKAPTVRTYDDHTGCRSLIDPGWVGTCGLLRSVTGRAAWVAESVDPHSYTDTRALLWRISPGGTKATLALRQVQGPSLLAAAPLDLGDGDIKVVFVTHPIGTARASVLDIVKPDARVVVHYGTDFGGVKIDQSIGPSIETWGYLNGTGGAYMQSHIGYLGGVWQIFQTEPSSPDRVPTDAL